MKWLLSCLLGMWVIPAVCQTGGTPPQGGSPTDPLSHRQTLEEAYQEAVAKKQTQPEPQTDSPLAPQTNSTPSGDPQSGSSGPVFVPSPTSDFPEEGTISLVDRVEHPIVTLLLTPFVVALIMVSGWRLTQNRHCYALAVLLGVITAIVVGALGGFDLYFHGPGMAHGLSLLLQLPAGMLWLACFRLSGQDTIMVVGTVSVNALLLSCFYYVILRRKGFS